MYSYLSFGIRFTKKIFKTDSLDLSQKENEISIRVFKLKPKYIIYVLSWVPEKEELLPVGGVGRVTLREGSGDKGHEEAGEGAEAVADAHEGAAVRGGDVHHIHHGRHIAAVERVACGQDCKITRFIA